MVKLLELGQTLEDKIDYDIVDDAIVYMRNEPMFYRQNYYPAISKMADCHRNGTDVSPTKNLMPMIEKGIANYCRKYLPGRMPDEIFKNADRQSIFNKIYSEEMEQINQGEYK